MQIVLDKNRKSIPTWRHFQDHLGGVMGNSARILIVDDDAEMRSLLVKRLSEYDFTADAAGNGDDMFKALASQPYDLILLDIMMPGKDGLELCRRLRAASGPSAAIPVIFMTALGEPTDRIVGLELGGDDYLPKPFEVRELIARIRAVLRRTSGSARQTSAQPWGLSPAIGGPPTILSFGNWKLDMLGRHLIDEQDMIVPLSATEFRLLVLFLEHPHQVLSRELILERTAGRTADVYDRSVDVQINRLRNKLRDTGKNSTIIRTMRGDGYMLSVSVDAEAI